MLGVTIGDLRVDIEHPLQLRPLPPLSSVTSDFIGMSQKKRKISDLTTDDTSRLLLALVVFQENLDETDEDLPQELIPALKKLAGKLQVVPVSGSSQRY